MLPLGQPCYKRLKIHLMSGISLTFSLNSQVLAGTFVTRGLSPYYGNEGMVVKDKQTSNFVFADYHHRILEGQASTDTERLSGQTIIKQLSLKVGRTINKSMLFGGYVTTRQQDISYDTAINRGYFSYNASMTSFEVGVGPSLRSGSLIFGGQVGSVFEGSETRKLVINGSGSKANIDSNQIPFMSVHGGREFHKATFMVGTKIAGINKVNKSNDTGNNGLTRSTINRTQTQTYWVVLQKIFTPVITIGAEFDFYKAAASSEQVSEDTSNHFNGQNTDKRNKDYYSTGISGSYLASDYALFNSSLTYIGDSYAKDSYASLIHSNLGGIRITVGGEVATLAGKLVYHAGYVIPRSVKYSVNDQHTTPWAQAQDTVTADQGNWEYLIGLDFLN